MTHFGQPSLFIVAIVLLLFFTVLVLLQLPDMRLMAVTVAVIGVAAVSCLEGPPSLIKVLSWIDYDSILIIGSTSIVVAGLEMSEMLPDIADLLFKREDAAYFWLCVTLVPSIASLFMENVTVMLLFVPQVIRICRSGFVDPMPVLRTALALANIAGTASPFGDQPNSVILADEEIYDDLDHFFVLGAICGVALAWLAAAITLTWLYKAPSPDEPCTSSRLSEMYTYLRSVFGGNRDYHRVPTQNLMEYLTTKHPQTLEKFDSSVRTALYAFKTLHRSIVDAVVHPDPLDFGENSGFFSSTKLNEIAIGLKAEDTAPADGPSSASYRRATEKILAEQPLNQWPTIMKDVRRQVPNKLLDLCGKVEMWCSSLRKDCETANTALSHARSHASHSAWKRADLISLCEVRQRATSLRRDTAEQHQQAVKQLLCQSAHKLAWARECLWNQEQQHPSPVLYHWTAHALEAAAEVTCVERAVMEHIQHIKHIDPAVPFAVDAPQPGTYAKYVDDFRKETAENQLSSRQASLRTAASVACLAAQSARIAAVSIADAVQESAVSIADAEQESFRNDANSIACAFKQYHKKVKQIHAQVAGEQAPASADRLLGIGCVIALGVIIAFFILRALLRWDVTMGFIAFCVAISLILLIPTLRDRMDELLEKMEWGTLLFFVGLSIFINSLQELHFMEKIGSWISSRVSSVPPEFQLFVAVPLIIVLPGFFSMFMDSVPVAAVMIPVIKEIAEDCDLPLSILTIALSMGVCFGGNGTMVAATSNIVTVAVAKRHGCDISAHFAVVGVLISVLTGIVAVIYMEIVALLYVLVGLA